MVKRWGPALLWMVAIFVLSNQPKDVLPVLGLWDFFFKKLAHFLAYGLLAGCYWWARQEGKRPFLVAMMLTIVYAISDEWHQSFVPGRHPTFTDILIDSLGGLTILGIIYFQQLRQRDELIT